MLRRLTGFVLLLLLIPAAWAHESRPAFLELTEVGNDTWSVVWKVPMRGDLSLGLQPLFPESCEATIEPVARRVGGALISRWNIRCAESLVGRQVNIENLDTTLTDVLVRVSLANGAVQTARPTPTAPYFTVQTEPGSLEVASTYTVLGIEHIWGGIDHLLFVLALLLIAKGWRRLIWAITAFTVSHSITLVAATLGFVNMPQAPVEAVIALSIVFLAMEIIHGLNGKEGLAATRPWLVAGSFGLLHGFGFAGALSEVGLPQHEIPIALLFFNVGVELGQLIFVALVLVAGRVLARSKDIPLRPVTMLCAYGIGGVAAFWTIERVAGFWG